MDVEFWQQRWRSNEIGFHEGRTNAFLAAHWPALGLRAGSLVFVPLCGKSADMTWLAAQGHHVIGVELSEIAVRDFFAENGLQPKRENRDGFEVSSAGGIEIWCGDFFKIEPRHLAGIAAVYDRASLIALPAQMQTVYAEKMSTLVPAGVPTLLVAFNYDQSQAPGPPFATPPEQVQNLFGRDFEVTLLERKDVLESNQNLRKRGLAWVEEQCLRLRRR